MEADHIVNHVANSVRNAVNMQDLASILDSAARDLGFYYFALIHHADLRRQCPDLIHLDNYPSDWTEHFIGHGLHINDPVLHAASRSAIAFSWADVPRMIKLSVGGRRHLEAARRAGLGSGFTVPSNIPGERRGSCSFALRPGRELPKQTLLATQLAGLFAFEAARRLTGAGKNAFGPPRLSARQRECIILAGQGKSDNVIAQLLGLSENTVTNYLAAARERYCVASRIQLAICALYDGEIGFTEMIHR